MSKSKGKVALNAKTAVKVSEGKDGKTKVAFSSAKDSDDEYSSVGTLTPKSAFPSPHPGNTTPTNNLTPNKRTSKTTPNTDSSGLLSVFGFGKKSVYMDSDDETSRNVTPMNKGVSTPVNQLPTVAETPPGPQVLMHTITATTPATPEEVKRLARYKRTLSTKGLVIEKVRRGTIEDTQERALFVDPTYTYLYWTESTNLACSEDTLKSIRRSLTASSKHKSFLSALTGASNEAAGSSGAQILTKNRKRTILISTIATVTVGTGEFSQFITVHMKPGAASGVYKMVIFRVPSKKDYELLLRVLGALLMPAPKSKYAVHFH